MDGEPRYNIRAVVGLTNVPAPTLRSWERRYGFPVPARSSTARRLYSDSDIKAIRRVRAQTERGLSAAQAIEWVQSGRDLQTELNAAIVRPSPPALIQAQIDGMRRFHESTVESALTVAFSHYPADHVLTEVITPALIQVGDLWNRGDIPVAAEHFYSYIIRRRLLSLLAAQPLLSTRMTVALACLPGEQHELGLLMLALFLRWSGARVLYLGANQPIDDLVLLAHTREIDATCLSAGAEADWRSLETLTTNLQLRPRPPRIYLGGPAASTVPVPDGIVVPELPLPAAAALIVAEAEHSTR